MNENEPDVLIELVSKALELLEDHGHAALGDFLADHPEHAETIRRRLLVLVDSGLPLATNDQDEMPEVLGDFRLLHPVGGGGMGVVWKAKQISLGREVALKLIRPDHLLFSDARDRFGREVETVARLQHPGIVPVYSVGEERGLPYYSMELVRGSSLAEVIAAVEGREAATLAGSDLYEALPDDGQASAGSPRSPLFDGAWHEVVFRIGREVAEALEHARRRGVIHRDVKPSNIMVTRGGRVLLLDFGLSSRGGDARLTRTGSAVGSLAYMAPESLPGSPRRDSEVSNDDPRLDVYSLGVTLYELLALAPPYEREDQLGLLRAALEGEATPLRSRNRAVPIDYVTVVGTAMEREPTRRYSTAGELALDIGNALELRPLEARPPGLFVRSRRWIQRNPVAATLYAAAVLVPSLLLAQEIHNRGVVEAKNIKIAEQAAVLASTNEDLASALEAATSERARAEAALAKAMDAVDRMLVRIGNETLMDVPGMEEVRRDVLLDALEFQEWFLENAEGLPSLHARAADVALGASRVHGWLGELEAAEAALDKAEASLDGIQDERSAQQARLLRLQVLATRAHVERLRGAFSEAELATEEALELLGPGEDESLAELTLRCRIIVDRARSLRSHGKVGEAERLLLDAVARAPASRSEIGGTDEDWTLLRFELARAHETLAMILDTQLQASSTLAPDTEGRNFDPELLARTREASQRSMELSLELLEEQPRSVSARHRAARALQSVALQEYHSGEPDLADQLYTRSVEMFEALIDDYPSVVFYYGDVAEALSNLAAVQFQVEDQELGLATMQRAADQYEIFFERGGDDLGSRIAYTGTLYNLGAIDDTRGEKLAALEDYDRALDALDLALQGAPDHAQGRWFGAVMLDQALPTFAQLGEAERLTRHLRAYFRRARNEQERLDILATLAQWPDKAIAAGALDEAEIEMVARCVEQAATELISAGLTSGDLDRRRIEGNPALAPLLFFGDVQDALSGR